MSLTGIHVYVPCLCRYVIQSQSDVDTRPAHFAVTAMHVVFGMDQRIASKDQDTNRIRNLGKLHDMYGTDEELHLPFEPRTSSALPPDNIHDELDLDVTATATLFFPMNSEDHRLTTRPL
jgi:hypothetical protein